jgi:hypothetical protein
MCGVTSTPTCTIMAWCLIEYRCNLNFTKLHNLIHLLDNTNCRTHFPRSKSQAVVNIRTKCDSNHEMVMWVHEYQSEDRILLQPQTVISGIRRGVNEIFALLEYYAALIGSYRRFWTTYRSLFQDAGSPRPYGLDGSRFEPRWEGGARFSAPSRQALGPT